MIGPKKPKTWVQHKQVHFTTVDGAMVTVDEGMYEVLTELKRLGVRTQFSCQGKDPFAAYVLADYRSFSRLIRKVRRNYRRGNYSPESRAVIRAFKEGHHSYELGLFFEQGTNEFWRVIFKRGSKNLEDYSIERSLDNHYKARLTVRWPKEDTPKILNLLREVTL